MLRRNYKRKKFQKTIESETSNQLLKFLSEKDFILSTNHVSYSNNIPCRDKLLNFIEVLEEIYENCCLMIEDKIHFMLWKQREALKCFVKEHNTMIKIPPTPIRGKNISQINIMKQKIMERQECLQQRSSLCKSKINFNGITSISSLNNFSEINKYKNNVDHEVKSYACPQNLNYSSCIGRKRRNTTEKDIFIEKQMKNHVQAELRRKLLLDEKVKRIKLEREEKIKQVQEKLRQQKINPIDKKNNLPMKKSVIETSKESKTKFLTHKNTKCYSKEQTIKKNIDCLNNKPTDFVDFKKPKIICEKKNERKRKSNVNGQVKFPIPPKKYARCLETNDSTIFVKNNKVLFDGYINIKKYSDNSTKLTNDMNNESYKVENISDCDTTDDENNPLGIVPKWAQFENLKISLTYQSETFDTLKKTDEIFGNFCFLKIGFSSDESHI